MNNLIQVEELDKSEAKKIVCYPKFTEEEFYKRLEELKKLNICFLKFDGKKKIGSFNVLGKGHASVVVKAVGQNGKTYALKIRRVDASKPDLDYEADILKKVESLDVGIKLYGSTKNLLLLEFIEGETLPEWIDRLKGKSRERKLKSVLLGILNQCRAMDKAGLDHGELSKASKHILVDSNGKPYIIDFGKASFKRRVSNVTSISQFLFIRGSLAKKIRRILGRINRKKLVEVLKNYKQNLDEKNFKRILLILGLTQLNH